jgi:hypothetical protein
VRQNEKLIQNYSRKTGREGPALRFMLFKMRVCGLINDSVSSSNYIASNDRMINEMKRIWKEAVVTYFKILFQDT